MPAWIWKLGTAGCMAAVWLSAGVMPASADLKYDGSVALGEIISAAAPAFKEKTGVTFSAIQLHGSDAAVRAVLSGQADCGGVARGLTPEERSQKIQMYLLGYDALGIFVHESNPVKTLTREQIKKIFQGSITRWREVGGEDRPITVWINLTPGRSVTKTFVALAMERDALNPRSKTTASPIHHLQEVATDRSAVTFDSTALSLGGIRAVAVDGFEPTRPNIQSGAYWLCRPVYLVCQDPVGREMKKFVDFLLSPAGQDLVRRGFLPVR